MGHRVERLMEDRVTLPVSAITTTTRSDYDATSVRHDLSRRTGHAIMSRNRAGLE